MTSRLAIWLNVAALPLLAVWAVVFGYLGTLLRPGGIDTEVTFTSPGELLAFFGLVGGGLIVTPILVVVLHEAIHGAAFWIFTRARPVFGFKLLYAYASAPGWYLSRGRYLAVCLAPLIILSVLGLGLVAVLPGPAVVLPLFAITLNAAAAIGDLYLCVRVLATPASTVIEDQHDRMTFYAPAVDRVAAPAGI